MTNFGKEQLYFKFNVFCEEIPIQLTFKDVSLLKLLWRRPERESAYQLRAEIRVIEMFYNRLPLPSLFSINSKMWDIFTWWYFGRSFSPPPSPRSWQWQNIFFKPQQRIRNNSRSKMTQEMWCCQPGKGCSYLWAPASQASVPAWWTRTPCEQAWRQVGPRLPCCPRPCTGSDRPPRHPPRTTFL